MSDMDGTNQTFAENSKAFHEVSPEGAVLPVYMSEATACLGFSIQRSEYLQHGEGSLSRKLIFGTSQVRRSGNRGTRQTQKGTPGDEHS